MTTVGRTPTVSEFGAAAPEREGRRRSAELLPLGHSGMGNPMENPSVGDPPNVVAMLAMLDYLISEVSRIDETSAQCLVLARQSLSDAATGAFPKPH